MKSNRSIPIRLARDEEFMNSFWNYDPENLIKEASEEFEKQFGIGGFRIARKEKWNSCGSSRLVDFPGSIVKKIPNDVSLEKISEFLMARFKEEIKVFSRSRLEEIFDVTGTLEGNHNKGFKIDYLIVRLDNAVGAALLEDLDRSFGGKESIKIGFTGKLVPAGSNLTLQASTSSHTNSIVVGIHSDSKVTLLHELGHLFGAEHNKKEESIMHFKVSSKEQHYTEEDKRQIRQGLIEKAMK